MKGRRALVIAPRLPEFDRESGLLRVSHIIDMLLRRNWEVTFGCLRTPTDPERYVRVLEQRGVETHTELESLALSAVCIALWACDGQTPSSSGHPASPPSHAVGDSRI